MKRIFAMLLCIAMLLCGCQTDPDAYVPTGDGLTADNGMTPLHPEQDSTAQELTLIYYPDRTTSWEISKFTKRIVQRRKTFLNSPRSKGGQKNGGWKFLSPPTILKRFLR